MPVPTPRGGALTHLYGINFHGIAERHSRSVTVAPVGAQVLGISRDYGWHGYCRADAEVHMTRAVLSAAIDTDWRLVSQERPCPVCGSQDACSVHTKDDFACCAREPSQWKLTTGAWLHRVQARTGMAFVPETIGQIDSAAMGSRIRL